MRTSVFVGVSLDGFLARRNDSYDFLTLNPGEDNGYDAFMSTVDSVVLGRRTYETVLPFDKWPYGERLVVVLSKTMKKLEPPRDSNPRFGGRLAGLGAAATMREPA